MILIYILVTALGSAAVLLWITKRRSAEVQTSLMAVHELRVRAWRKRVQAAETDGPEAETFALEAATLGRRAYDALQDLRAEYQEGGHFADDAFDGSIEEEMEALTTLPSHLGRDPAAADEARHHLARASHDAAAAARTRHGRTQWRVPATQAPVGALVGAAYGGALLYYYYHHPWLSPFYDYIDDGIHIANVPFSPVLWIVGGAIIGALLVAFLSEDLWNRIASRPRWVMAGLVFTVAELAIFGLPTYHRYGRGYPTRVAANYHFYGLRSMWRGTGCPREIPPVRERGLKLSPLYECILVENARRGLPDLPETHAFRSSGDPRGIEVAVIENGSGLNLQSDPFWQVGFTAGGQGPYWIRVDKATGTAAAFPHR